MILLYGYDRLRHHPYYREHKREGWLLKNDRLTDTRVLHLLKKGRRSLLGVVFSRTGVVTLALLANIALLVLLVVRFESFWPHFWTATTVFTAGMVLILLTTSIDASAKVTWLILFMALPVVGALLFAFTRLDLGHRALKKRVETQIAATRELLPQNEAALCALKQNAPGAAGLARYVDSCGCHPVYTGTQAVYLPLGEAKLEALCAAIEKAEHFIFLEYFIIREGEMWGRILQLLAKKAAAGVEVRVLVDGTCEYTCLPSSYPKQLATLGIHCKMFAPVTPFVSTHYNYRDHRKIAVIDGHTGFTGGINLSDEYINRTAPHGHWKDTAIELHGAAVRSLTLLFLQMWCTDGTPLQTEGYLAPVPALPQATGWVLPYGDCPVDGDHTGELVYMDMLARAQHSVRIMTPYLIVDGELETALIFAARRGVTVELILPGIPDKQIPYALAKTHYPALLAAGVKIFEYTPGFIHAKVMTMDGCEAVVGTINFDYRSLYHHFECAVWMRETPCIADIEADFAATRQQCRAVTPAMLKKEPLWRKLAGFILKAAAPLL